MLLLYTDGVTEARDSEGVFYPLVENVHRADLNALEEAAAYQQLIEDFSLTHEAVATRVGRSRTAVTNTLRLLQLPPSVQRHLVTQLVEPKPLNLLSICSYRWNQSFLATAREC